MARISRADRADDAALLAGLALGDAAVSAAFVRRFQGAVYGLAVSITRDPRAAEDVSQEVFLRVWRAADTYDVRRASVLTWILTTPATPRSTPSGPAAARRPTGRCSTSSCATPSGPSRTSPRPPCTAWRPTGRCVGSTPSPP